MNAILILVSVTLNCLAQVFIRKGMLVTGEIGEFSKLLSAIPHMITNVYLWGAMICYTVSFLTWMMVLSKVEVSYAYPLLSMGYVLAAIIGYFWLSEHLSPVRVVGILVICLGVFLISRS